MGDDGHWKPPPFEAGFGRAVVPPPPAPPGPSVGGPGPWAGAPMGPPPMPPSKGSGGTVLAIVGGVVAVVVLVPVVLILAVTLLGRQAEPSFQSVGTAVGPDDGALVPIDPDPALPTNPIGADPELAAWCPTGEDVAATLGDVSGPPAEAQPTTMLEMNGIGLDADLCYYGGTIDIGRIPSDDAAATLDTLRDSSGRYTTSDAGLGVPSVRLVLPGGESGAVRLVFVHGDELLTVALNGADDGSADHLARLLLARPPG